MLNAGFNAPEFAEFIKYNIIFFDAELLVVELYSRQKIAITVNLCFIETKLKQDFDLQSHFITRETTNVLTIMVSHYFLMKIFQKQSFGGVLQKRCS